MNNTWLVLLPAILVLIVTFITKKLNYALIIGIITAACIARDFSFIPAGKLIISRLYNQFFDLDNIYLYLFLLILGIIIALLEYSGGANAFAHLLTNRLRSKRMTETSSLLLSGSLFIDDYLSCLVTGFVMRPLTDQFRIPRTKLAYLIHSFSGPIVILAPISSWVALITSQLDKAGVSPLTHPATKILTDPFYVYLNSIPFIFYSLILIASVIFIVRAKISYGPMHSDELIAQQTGNLFGGKKAISHAQDNELAKKSGSAIDLILPICILIITFIIGILYSGGYYLFGGSYSFLIAIQKNTQTSLALLIASLITITVSLIRLFYKKVVSYHELSKVSWTGINLMQSSVIMVFLASTFGLMLREDLQTGFYLAHTFLNSLHLFLLPFIFYLVSIFVSLITGSAWGTIALMVPIAIQILTTLIISESSFALTPALQNMLFPTLGAIFSGAVCGNHISPLSETTIMSSNSAGCYPLDHANTQFWYALPAILCAGFSFLLAGLLLSSSCILNALLSFTGGLIPCILIVCACNKWWKKTN